MASVRVGKRGTVVIPREIRERLHIDEGELLLMQVVDGAVVIRPAIAVPVEEYSPERRAEFILNDAIDSASYRAARERVERMGLNPDAIPHERPDEPKSR